MQRDNLDEPLFHENGEYDDETEDEDCEGYNEETGEFCEE